MSVVLCFYIAGRVQQRYLQDSDPAHRHGGGVCANMCACACVLACMRVCARVRVRACVDVCVCGWVSSLCMCAENMLLLLPLLRLASVPLCGTLTPK